MNSVCLKKQEKREMVPIVGGEEMGGGVDRAVGAVKPPPGLCYNGGKRKKGERLSLPKRVNHD